MRENSFQIVHYFVGPTHPDIYLFELKAKSRATTPLSVNNGGVHFDTPDTRCIDKTKVVGDLL